MTVLLRARNIRHSYGKIPACSVGEIAFGEGTISAVVGPSGAGKTTFLRILAGLTAPGEGQVWYRGVPLYRQGRGRRVVRKAFDLTGLVMVLHEPHLFRGTAGFNLAYGLWLRGVSCAQRRKSVAEVARLLGLDGMLDRRVDALSAGEAQRVALGRALVLRPRVVLLDEPTANLDPANMRIIEEALVQVSAGWNAAVVMVTHNLAQARRIADRISFFDGGTLQSTEPVEAFFRSPLTGEQRAFLEGEVV